MWDREREDLGQVGGWAAGPGGWGVGRASTMRLQPVTLLMAWLGQTGRAGCVLAPRRPCLLLTLIGNPQPFDPSEKGFPF